MSIIRWAFAAIATLAVAAACAPDSFDYTGDGERAPESPRQSSIKPPMEPWVYKDHTFTGRDRIEVQARVLAVKRYRLDRGASIMPIDLALGWGPMSDERLIRKIDVSQFARWYRWEYEEHIPGGHQMIGLHSANMHMVPASRDVWKQLKRATPGDTIRVSGILVDIEGEDGARWRTSLRRSDVGAGACEIIWVESAQLTK